jgi:hypothetical protein
MNRPAFRVALAGLVGLAAGACSGKPSTPAAGPARAASVQGTLLEGYTGRAIDSAAVVLFGQRRTQRAFVATATPDASGRFRFERVERDSTLVNPDVMALGWKPAQGDVVYASNTPGGSDYVYVDLRKAAGTPLDLGTRYVWMESAAVDTFAPACRGGQKITTAPAGTPVVVFQIDRGKGPAPSSRLHKELASAWPPGWKGVVCIENKETEVGRYGFVNSSTAIKVSWKVSVTRLPEGQTFRATFDEVPPKLIQVDEWGRPFGSTTWERKGDPLPKLRHWLQGLAKSQ